MESIQKFSVKDRAQIKKTILSFYFKSLSFYGRNTKKTKVCEYDLEKIRVFTELTKHILNYDVFEHLSDYLVTICRRKHFSHCFEHTREVDCFNSPSREILDKNYIDIKDPLPWWIFSRWEEIWLSSAPSNFPYRILSVYRKCCKNFIDIFDLLYRIKLRISIANVREIEEEIGEDPFKFNFRENRVYIKTERKPMTKRVITLDCRKVGKGREEKIQKKFFKLFY